MTPTELAKKQKKELEHLPKDVQDSIALSVITITAILIRLEKRELMDAALRQVNEAYHTAIKSYAAHNN